MSVPRFCHWVCLALFVGGSTPGGLHAADPPVPEYSPLWSGQSMPTAGMPPLPWESETMRNDRVYNVSNPGLFHYRPAAPIAPNTAVIILPGGGYQRLAIAKEGHAVGRWFASRGLHAFVLKYRVGHVRHPAAFHDTRQAIALVRRHLRKQGNSPLTVGLLGFSAGGHLAAMTANRHDQPNWPTSDRRADDDCQPDFTILVYPVIHFDGPDGHHNSAVALLGSDHPEPGRFSVQRLVRIGAPPALLIHARDDQAVPVSHTLAYRDALAEVGTACELRLLPRGGHSFGLGSPAPDTTPWQEQALHWIKQSWPPVFEPTS